MSLPIDFISALIAAVSSAGVLPTDLERRARRFTLRPLRYRYAAAFTRARISLSAPPLAE